MTGLRVAADVIIDRDLELARIWHTPAAIELAPSTRCTLVIVIDGAFRVSLPGSDAIEVGPYDAFIVVAGDSARLDNAAPGARIEFDLGSSGMQRLTMSTHRRSGLLDDTDVVRTFAAAANAILSSSLESDSRAWPYARSSLEALFGALLSGADRGASGARPSAKRELVVRAHAVIQRRSTDPSFGVEALLRELSVSGGYLRAAFDSVGTSPFREIRRARVRSAVMLMGARRSRSAGPTSQVARASGFRSLRALRAALAQFASDGGGDALAADRDGELAG